MRIAVIGGGAVGCALSAILARDGYNVTLAAKTPFHERINQSGVQLLDSGNCLFQKIRTVGKLDFQPDFAFITVKTQDLNAACSVNRNMLIESKIVLVQNGVKAMNIAAGYFKTENMIRCLVLFNAKKNGDGVIEISGKKTLVIGGCSEKAHKNVSRIFKIMKKSFQVKIIKDVKAAEWTKLLINIFSNSIESITGKRLTECVNEREILLFGIFTLKEAYRVTNQSGIKLVSIPHTPLLFLKLLMAVPSSITLSVFKSVFGSPAYGNITTSTLQSLQRKRKTEIDYLNGEIIELGKTNAIPTPFNAKVLEIVHKIEKDGIFMSLGDIGKCNREMVF